MTEQGESYTREEVTRRGFEARCVTGDSVEYLWHVDCGLRADPRTRSTTLITDPAVLPEGPWRATELGIRELTGASPHGPARDDPGAC
jgi:hypothetical protein